MAQLLYPVKQAKGFAGQLADISPRNDVLTRHSEEATSFPYGTAVVAGTDTEKQMLLPTGAANLLGVTSHSHAREVGADGLNLVDLGRCSNVLHVGRIFVKLEGTCGAMVAGDPLFVRIATPSAVPADDEGLGRFRHDVDTAAALAVTGIRLLESGGPGDIVMVEIDPGASIA